MTKPFELSKFTCMWNDKDDITLVPIGEYLHFQCSSNEHILEFNDTETHRVSFDVVLKPTEVIRLRDALTKHLVSITKQ